MKPTSAYFSLILLASVTSAKAELCSVAVAHSTAEDCVGVVVERLHGDGVSNVGSWSLQSATAYLGEKEVARIAQVIRQWKEAKHLLYAEPTRVCQVWAEESREAKIDRDVGIKTPNVASINFMTGVAQAGEKLTALEHSSNSTVEEVMDAVRNFGARFNTEAIELGCN